MSSPVFARHETFHPRHSWLKKGFDKAAEDSEVFVKPDAHVTLGVGKNMVRAIRYWCHAFKLLDEDNSLGGRATGSTPSELGRMLLSDDQGFDPYLEDLGSLWLLHWNLLKEPCSATAWQYAFFVHGRQDLSVDELTGGLSEYVDRHFSTARTAESSLRKDAACIIRMYGEVATGKAISEETIQCPFSELGLMRQRSDSNSYSFRTGNKPGLSPELITAACLEYAAARGEGSRTISLSQLSHQPGSPGLAFKISEGSLYAALEQAMESETSLGLSDTAGIVQLSFREPPLELARELVVHHYNVRTAVKAAL